MQINWQMLQISIRWMKQIKKLIGNLKESIGLHIRTLIYSLIALL
jgi:hypothetical protein